jgi:radical SAM protein with 4Fe4S-binding SPASM domain
MAYRILNGLLNPRVPCQDLREDERPELIYIEIPKRHKQFAFDSNSLALLQVDSFEDYLQLRDHPPSPYVMARYKPVFRAGGAPEPKVGNLVLEATHACNLSCKYCFVSMYPHKGYDGDVMTFEMAKRAIDDLVNVRQHFTVGFFGGEPLTNWPLILKVTEYVEHLAKQFGQVCRSCGGSGRVGGSVCENCLGLGKQRPGLHVTTNTTLFTPERVAFLNDHGYSLICSIDGTQKSQDHMRRYANGRSSWQKVMKGLKLLKGTRLVSSNTLRSTFPANSVETIRERLDYLNQLCDDGCANWVSVEPVALSHDSPLKNRGLEIKEEEAWDRFEDEYLDAADWWIERAKADKTPRWHNVHKSIERMFWSIHSASECFSGDTKVSLLDGTERTLESIVGQEHWFYSVCNGEIISTKGVGVKTGEGRSLLEVELDNGQRVKCTPDHLWMMRDGTYKRADQLQPGDSLMPWYGKVLEESTDCFKGSQVTHTKYCKVVQSNHKVISVKFVTGLHDTYCVQIQHDCHNFALTAGVFVRNCGASRGYLSVNGKGMIFACHREGYSKIGDLSTGIDEELRAPWLDNRGYQRKDCMKCPVRWVCGSGCFTGDTGVKMVDGTNHPIAELVGLGKQWFYSYHPGWKEFIVTQGEVRKTRENMPLMEVGLDNGEKVKCTPDHEWMMSDGTMTKSCELKCGDSLMPFYESKKGKDGHLVNHRVISVKWLEEKQDVYCVVIDHPCHNFVLSAGVVVGNCREDSLASGRDIHTPDPAQCVLKSLWIESALHILSELPKQTIAKYVKDPSQQRGKNCQLCSYLPGSEIKLDPAGVPVHRWSQNIPVTALVREDGKQPCPTTPVGP